MVDVSDSHPDPNQIDRSHGSLDIEISEEGAEILAEIAIRLIPQTAPIPYLYEEIEAQQKLIQQEFYKPVVIRQAALFENLLALQVKHELEQQKGEELSSQEADIADNLGYRKILNLGFILDIYSENERRKFKQLFSARHNIAHNHWTNFDEDDHRTFRNVSNQIYEKLQQLLYDIVAESELLDEKDIDL